MILPFVSVEAMAERAWRELGAQEGVDRTSYLLGFIDGAQALSMALQEASKAQTDGRR